MSDIEIKEAAPEDAEKLLAHLKIIGGETDNLTFGKEGLPLSVEEEKNFLRISCESQKSALFLAWDGGEIVGDGSLSEFPRRMEHRGELGLSVKKAWWGRGIGSRLMGRLLAHARENGVEVISLEVRSDNTRAIRLYEKYGFQRIGTFPAFFKIDGQYFDFELMYLDLRQVDDFQI